MGWREQTRSMFGNAEEAVRDVAEIWVDNVVEDMVKNTVGPGNQLPDTEYIATGRLRGGWRGGENPPANVGRMDGGPYDEDGDATVSAVMATFKLDGVWSVWNEVGYSYYVFHGLGNHPYPRNPITGATLRSWSHFQAARSAVMRLR